jgi:hypothetical protein
MLIVTLKIFISSLDPMLRFYCPQEVLLAQHRYEYVEKLENNVPGQAEFDAFFVTHYSTRI